jgi:hypothetical protein
MVVLLITRFAMRLHRGRRLKGIHLRGIPQNPFTESA